MSSNKPFRFKCFEVHQSRSAMKVGTDGVLLGAWARVTNAHRILDVGTGNGVIALLCAQRNASAEITGIEIIPGAAEDALENFSISPWSDRLKLIEGDFLTTDFTPGFDVIISNPPFFTRSIPAVDPGRRAARHDDALPAEKFFGRCAELLEEKGRVIVIFPKNTLKRWIKAADQWDLHPVRVCHVFTLPQKDSTRVMVEFARHPAHETFMESILIENRPGEYSEPYKKLLRDFYLIFD